ncbi:hypothetical protein GOP47_0029424 [Adiantum capillus-veneris]|nr:hypothetical protein GOP47_0029424 [Adiantum capillus-veneris]
MRQGVLLADGWGSSRVEGLGYFLPSLCVRLRHPPIYALGSSGDPSLFVGENLRAWFSGGMRDSFAPGGSLWFLRWLQVRWWILSCLCLVRKAKDHVGGSFLLSSGRFQHHYQDFVKPM